MGSLSGLCLGSGVGAGTQSVLGALASQTHGYLAVLAPSILFFGSGPMVFALLPNSLLLAALLVVPEVLGSFAAYQIGLF